jgi:hypothetical protein
VKRFLPIVIVLLSVPAFAQSNAPTLFVTPTDDGFDTYIVAAMQLKKVPVDISTKQDGVDYVLTAAKVAVTQVTTGAKFANCLFASCAGNNDKASTSVKVTQGDRIVWSYAVAKGWGAKNQQSMAEAIAKHFYNDFIKTRPRAAMASAGQRACQNAQGKPIACP